MQRRFQFSLPMTSPISPWNWTSNSTAGIIVAVLLIPQCMAYAVIAGVPPVLGLYAASFPALAYLMFGSSKHLSIGPVSIVAMLSFSGINKIELAGTIEYYELLFVQSFLVGAILLLLGCFRFGQILDHLSSDVVTGFTSAAAIVIGLNQLETLLGVPLSNDLPLLSFLAEIARNLHDVHPITFSLGITCLVGLFVIKRIIPLSIGPLLIMIISIFLVHIHSLQSKGVETIGEVPKGLPQFHFFVPEIQSVVSLLPSALGIALIVFLESYAIAKSIAGKDGYSIKSDRELIGLGFANITSSLLGSIPVAGAFSRTAVNYHSGATSKLSSLITVFILFLCIMSLGPLLAGLPKFALSAIIIYAVFGLIDVRHMSARIRNEPLNGFVMLATFSSTLIINVLEGLLIGIGISLITTLLIKLKIITK
jgi:SulP family sulfate permease